MHYRLPRPLRKGTVMNAYDEVELTKDCRMWGLHAGARGAIVDAVPGEDFVAVEFYGPNGEHAVHLVRIALLRVTDRSTASVSSASSPAHP